VRSVILLLLVLIGPAVLAQEESSPRQVLDACIDSLDVEIAGLEAMERACPGLGAALERLGIAALLPENERAVLTRDGLVGLRMMHDRFHRPPERGEIDVAALQPVLESLREPPESERAQPWFERFKRWLREAFDRQEEQSNPWLRRWLDEHPLSETVQRILFYGVMVLVIVLAIVIVGNEIRAARVGRRKMKPASADFGLAAAASSDSMAEELPGQRASALLRMLIAALVKTDRLHGAYSLTHRELIARAEFDDAAQSESFRRVARLAEQEIFGSKPASGTELDDALQAGHRLHQQLLGAAP
jgi:hypothetical protein